MQGIIKQIQSGKMLFSCLIVLEINDSKLTFVWEREELDTLEGRKKNLKGVNIYQGCKTFT